MTCSKRKGLIGPRIRHLRGGSTPDRGARVLSSPLVARPGRLIDLEKVDDQTELTRSNGKAVTLYARNLSCWGPSAVAVSRRRTHDCFIFPESHKLPAETEVIINELQGSGLIPVVVPARPSDKSLAAGGIVMAAKAHLALSSYRYLLAGMSNWWA